MVRNILLITADDLNWNTPGCFGGTIPAITPNIDALAASGRCFDRAHVTVAVCLPSRSVLMSGRYPHRNGSEGFVPMRAETPSLPEQLADAGYLTGIFGKVTHCAPPAKFRWGAQLDVADLGMGRNPDKYRGIVKDFLQQARSEDRPFFLMANSHDPHRPFHGSEQEQVHFSAEQRATYPDPSRSYTPDEIAVPGFLPDLDDVRLEISEYAGSVRRLDDTVGVILKELEEAGFADDTAVFFLSDNGMALPFAKTNCYLNSTCTPLIVRWPGKTEAGSRDSAHFVSGIDFWPTVAEGLGLPATADIDGRSFLNILDGSDDDQRGSVHTVFHETAGKRRYEMRCRQDGDFGYIYNAWSDGVREFQNESQSGRTMAAMRKAAEHDQAIADRVNLFVHRVPEEFYDFRNDPDGLHNLINEAEHQPAIAAARQALLHWMTETEDHLLQTYQAFTGDVQTA